MQTKHTLAELAIPVMTCEGNMADKREFNEARTTSLIDLFVTRTLGLKKLTG